MRCGKKHSRKGNNRSCARLHSRIKGSLGGRLGKLNKSDCNRATVKGPKALRKRKNLLVAKVFAGAMANQRQTGHPAFRE
jgi:hypothetical protein